MRKGLILLLVGLAVVSLGAQRRPWRGRPKRPPVTATCATDVTTCPRVQSTDVTYLGYFTLPNPDWNTEAALHFGGWGLGIGPSGSLYYGGHDWYERMARVSIPAVGETATILDAAVDITNGTLQNLDNDPGEQKNLGGSVIWNGRMIFSGYVYYDGEADAVATHWARSGTSITSGTVTGPVRVSATNPTGATAGYMAVVPTAWRTALGGPVISGNCCLAVVSRTSFGPALVAFDPDGIGVSDPVAASTLLYYPQAHPINPGTAANDVWNGTTMVKGVAILAGTRSALFFMRHGTGTYCYGSGTSDIALDGTPDGQGNVYCYDPADASKGVHAWPYRLQVEAFDLNDLVAVKNGSQATYAPQPYAVFALPSSSAICGNSCMMNGAALDPATNRLYVAANPGTDPPQVYVWQFTAGS